MSYFSFSSLLRSISVTGLIAASIFITTSCGKNEEKKESSSNSTVREQYTGNRVVSDAEMQTILDGKIAGVRSVDSYVLNWPVGKDVSVYEKMLKEKFQLITYSYDLRNVNANIDEVLNKIEFNPADGYNIKIFCNVNEKTNLQEFVYGLNVYSTALINYRLTNFKDKNSTDLNLKNKFFIIEQKYRWVHYLANDLYKLISKKITLEQFTSKYSYYEYAYENMEQEVQDGKKVEASKLAAKGNKKGGKKDKTKANDSRTTPDGDDDGNGNSSGDNDGNSGSGSGNDGGYLDGDASDSDRSGGFDGGDSSGGGNSEF